jgi:hypothetical protein
LTFLLAVARAAEMLKPHGGWHGFIANEVDEAGCHILLPYDRRRLILQLALLRVSRDREQGFQRIVSNDFRGS